MGLISRVFTGVGAVAYGSTVYNLADGGLSKGLVLETLTHGTSILNNLSIRISGGLPSEGGSVRGSGHANLEYRERSLGYFHLFKDSEHMQKVLSESEIIRKDAFDDSLTGFFKRDLVKVIPKMITHKIHAALSSYRHAKSYFSNDILCGAFAITGIASPTLRFRFSCIDPGRMQEDKDYSDGAYKTRQIAEPWRIGPIGSCLTGFNSNWLDRVKDNPSKALAGAVQLIIAAAMLRLGRSYAIRNLSWVVAGAVMA